MVRNVAIPPNSPQAFLPYTEWGALCGNWLAATALPLELEYTCTARDLRVLGCDDLGTVVEAI